MLIEMGGSSFTVMFGGAQLFVPRRWRVVENGREGKPLAESRSDYKGVSSETPGTLGRTAAAA